MSKPDIFFGEWEYPTQNYSAVFDADREARLDMQRRKDFRANPLPSPVPPTYQNVDPGYLQWDQQAFRPTARDLGVVNQVPGPMIPGATMPGAVAPARPESMVNAGNVNPLGYGAPISNDDIARARTAELRAGARTAYDNAVAAGLDMPARPVEFGGVQPTARNNAAQWDVTPASAAPAPAPATSNPPRSPLRSLGEEGPATALMGRDTFMQQAAAPAAAQANRPSTRSDSWVGSGTPRPGTGFMAPPRLPLRSLGEEGPATFSRATTGTDIANTVTPPDFGSSTPARRTNNPNATPVGRSANDPDRMFEAAARRTRGNPMQQAQIASMIRAPQERAQERMQTRQWQVEDRTVNRQNQIEDRTQSRDWTIEDRDLGFQQRNQEIQQRREWEIQGNQLDPQPVQIPNGPTIYRTNDGREVYTQDAPPGPVESMPIPGTDYFLPHQGGRPVGGPLPSPARNAPPEFNVVQGPNGETAFMVGNKVVPPSSMSIRNQDGEWEPLVGDSSTRPFVRSEYSPELGYDVLYQWNPQTGIWDRATLRMNPADPSGATSATSATGSAPAADPGDEWMRQEAARREAAAAGR